ncbi:MAG TPA: hypothetical protein VHX14_03185 [Thermoanaerobaculia bacterium]|jgi:hypothetical protein|nr:hypothetical protein [Thermoanaerobaculia bacterium]
MPSSDEVLSLLVNDAVFLRFAWDNHRFLFRESERVTVLNAAAASFFSWTEMLLVDDVLMRISRLTDPAGNPHQENLTLEGLLRATNWEMSDPPKMERFRQKLAEVATCCKTCRAHRNKRLSHSDFKVATKQTPLPTVTIGDIDGAVKAIERFIQEAFSAIRPNESQSFQIIDGEKYVTELITYLTNRPSRRMHDIISTILIFGDDWAELHCGYCGERNTSYFPGADKLDGERLRYWHFGSCCYVVGNESVVLKVVSEADPSATTVTVSLAKN